MTNHTLEEVMHIIGDYTFDSDKLIVYKSDVDAEKIKEINMSLTNSSPYESTLLYLKSLNSDEMRMDKIAVNNIGICFTYNCNLRCNYCGYSSTDNDRNKLELSDVEMFVKDIIKKRAIKKLLTKKNEALNVYFTGGGEPTYDWDLLKDTVLFIHSQCSDNKIPLNLRMTTNGVLSSEKIEFISKNFNDLMISYDGLPEIQNLNRRSPSIGDTALAVEHSIREFANRGVPLTIRTTIWQDDFLKINEMYHHIFSLVPENSNVIWSIYPTLLEGRAIKRIREQDDITYKKFLLCYIGLIEHIISEKGEERIKAIDVPLFTNNTCEIFCGAYKLNFPWLLPDKSIVTCMESNENKVCIGKIDRGELKYFNKYCDSSLKIMQEKFTLCRTCIAYHFCRGGCPVWHLRRDTEKDESPECSAQKEYWKYVIEAVLSGKYSFGWHLEKVDLPNISQQEIFKLVKNQKGS